MHSFQRPCPRYLHLSSLGVFAIRSIRGCLHWVGWHTSSAKRQAYQ
jgi:hypothetical protein